MPSSSMRFTSDASVKRAGGLVVCPSAVSAGAGRASPSATGGRTDSASSRSASSSSLSST